jgi:zinc finger protein
MTSQAQHDPFFKPIGEHVGEGEDGSEEQLLMTTDENGEQRMVEEIESLCLECHQQGTTRLLMTYIPYFREVIVVSFFCPHCGNRNNEIQSAGQIQPKGCIYTIHVTNVEDLNRQVVKSEHATITIPEIQLTIPNKRGQLTTVEGVLSDTLRDLELGQPLRKHTQPEVHDRIQSICDRLRKILGEEKVVQAEGEDKEEEAVPDNNGLRSHGPVGGSYELQDKDEKRTFAPITMKMDDPSGNSFVEFMGAIEGKGMSDAKWSKRDYPRTTEQNTDLGLGLQEQPTAQEGAEEDTREGGIGTKGGSSAVEEGRESKRSKGPDGGAVPTAMASRQEAEKEALGGGFSKEAGETEFTNEEVFSFDGTCSSCSFPLKTLMKKVNVPYFKDILIMSTNCDSCGYRDNEVKSGSAIPPKGKKLTLRVEDAEDLSRDVLKSESAGLSIPAIDLHLSPGTLGGRFTTLEGLLQQVYDELSERVLMRGDSSLQSNNFENFLGKLKKVMNAEICPYIVILDDPLADSYIQNPYAPEPDEQIEEEEYERTWDQNEDLGLNDIKVDDYSEESKQWREDAEKKSAMEVDATSS